MAHQIVVTGAFDDVRAHTIRFLQQAARHGEITVLLWPDEVVRQVKGEAPKFPLAERLYFLQSLRYVKWVAPSVEPFEAHALSLRDGFKPDTWMVEEHQDHQQKQVWCEKHGVSYRVVRNDELGGFPLPPVSHAAASANRKRVIVTGTYDWFHSGHIRFFEEASSYGDLYVTVGHDANIRLLKGEGHPLIPEKERCFMVSAIRFVKHAMIATGHGWLDAEPEIQRIKPHIYAVNEDGDKGGKREYCQKHGIEYLVLKRIPAPGLPKRSSTDLRGF